MLFSAIARTGERFGAAHVIDVVRGADTEKVRERGHDRLPTHGVGADVPKSYWQGLVRQCLASGFLELDIEGFGGLRLTATGRQVLQGLARVEIREITLSKKAVRAQRVAQAVETGDVDGDMLARLKQLRKRLAADKRVPAYVVFSDATLIEMSVAKPQDLDALGEVKGVGPKKLEDYGEAFLRELTSPV